MSPLHPRFLAAALATCAVALTSSEPAIAATLVVANKAEATASLIDLDSGEVVATHANADVITEVDVEKGEILRLLTAGKEPDGMGYSSQTVGTKSLEDSP